MRFAIIKNGVVENIALWDWVTFWDPGDYDLVNIEDMPWVDIGMVYDGSVFEWPPKPEPEVEE